MNFKSAYVLFSLLISANIFSLEIKKCDSSKEFITGYNYLKDKKELELPVKSIFSHAKEISTNCTGSANRFIQTVNFLIDAEIPSNDALKKGKAISALSDQHLEAFLSIFKKIYVEKYFDLSAIKSLKIASELTESAKKSPAKILADFEKLGEYCMGKEGLELGFEKCSDFIATTLSNSNEYDESISESVISFIDFLTKEEKGPKLPINQALIETEKTAMYGISGFNNFREGFIFSFSEKGLGLGLKESLDIGRDLSKNAIKKLP
jgi:hypothetical protein